MEKVDSLICTHCGSHHIEVVNDELFKCTSCDALIKKEKALDFEEQYKKLQAEDKAFDIANLRSLVRKALEGHIDKDTLIKYSQDILRVLPGDVLSLFYIKFANRIIYPSDYEYYLNLLLKEATQTEMDEIIDIIITNARFREKEQIINIINKFYKGREDKLTELEKALKQRTKEIELFSDIPRDIFICHSSLDKDKVNEILKMLEEDGNTCWISSRNIPWDSDNYWLNIEKAIKSCNIFLCLNSINTMQSNDCRREVEIASSLNKKRIEYKLDESRDITLFKNFFTGQWITNINDLLIKVYDLKHKEESEYKNAIKLLLAKDYIKAKEAFENIKGYQDANEYLDICNSLIKAENLINEKMYNEAKERLISLNSTLRSSNSHTIFSLIKELINKCDDLFTEEEIDNAEINLNMGLFSSAEDIYKRLVVKYKSNYRIWYGYLESVSRNFTSNKNESIRAIYENTIKYVPNSDEKRKLIEKCKSLFMDNTSSDSESIEKNNDEEGRKKKAEEARKLTDEKNKLRNCCKGNIIEFGSYPQTIKADNVTIISTIKDKNGCHMGSDGEKYVLLKANPCYIKNKYSSDLFSNGEKIIKDKEYYFKVEPIKWKVLEEDNDKLFLFSELILDSHRFDDNSSDYSISNIRKWLNNEFYNKAFVNKQKELIKDTSLKDISNTKDKIFLLSEDDITNTAYGFSDFSYDDETRCKKVTDYAKANFTFEHKENNGWYWLRTPFYDFLGAGDVNCNGFISGSNVYGDDHGVVPALLIDKTKV